MMIAYGSGRIELFCILVGLLVLRNVRPTAQQNLQQLPPLHNQELSLAAACDPEVPTMLQPRAAVPISAALGPRA